MCCSGSATTCRHARRATYRMLAPSHTRTLSSSSSLQVCKCRRTCARTHAHARNNTRRTVTHARMHAHAHAHADAHRPMRNDSLAAMNRLTVEWRHGVRRRGPRAAAPGNLWRWRWRALLGRFILAVRHCYNACAHNLVQWMKVLEPNATPLSAWLRERKLLLLLAMLNSQS
jgi:hypothetical protein